MLSNHRSISKSPVECPACGAKTHDVRYLYRLDDRTSDIFHCNNCTMMFALPILLLELDERQMDCVDDAELFNNPLLKRLHRDYIIKPEISHVKRLLGKETFSLLDIGCGTGWTTSIWSEEGATATGLEPSAARAAVARDRYGLRVIPSFVEDLEGEEQFEVIVMRHVLEHFAEPFDVLQKVTSHLKPGGLLVVIVPNINCIGRYLFGTRWTWVLPWHCNFFTPKSLPGILKRAGLSVETRYQTPSPLWYPESLLSLLPAKAQLIRKAYARLSALMFLPFAPLLLVGHLLRMSDNLTVMARKP
jgi:SAM-dependent methyltransferase